MNAVLLAGGYGTRLYPLTKDTPKALLPLGKGVVLDAIVESLLAVPDLSDTVLVTNHRFVDQFQAWRSARHVALTVVDDETTTPENRIGAINDLLLGLKRLHHGEDALVLGTDNLFTWSLADFAASAKTRDPAATIAIRRVTSTQEASRCGVVEMDTQGRLTRCIEKPTNPPALTVALCVYYFPQPMQHRLTEFVISGGNADAPGFFLEWLVKTEPVYGSMTQGEWVDIGSQETYQQAVAQWALRQPSSSASS